MLDALKSLYMTCFSDVCKKARPRAAPNAILRRIFHERGWKAELPAHNVINIKKLLLIVLTPGKENGALF